MAVDVKLVTLDDFYHTVDQEPSREFFGKMSRLRAQGYGPDYPDNYLPMDAADLVCRHHLMCRPGPDGSWQPFAGFRQIPIDRCDRHGLDVPLLHTVRKAGASLASETLEAFLAKGREASREMIYSASLTMCKDLRGDRDLAKLVRELLAAFLTDDHFRGGQAPTLGAAVLRFKTHLWFPEIGFQPLQSGGQDLPVIQNHAAGGEPFIIMHIESPSLWARQCLARHQKIFEERLWIGPAQPESAQLPRKAAA